MTSPSLHLVSGHCVRYELVPGAGAGKDPGPRHIVVGGESISRAEEGNGPRARDRKGRGYRSVSPLSMSP